MNSVSLKKDLGDLADPKKTKILSRFFKTGKGEYGEGDIFLGISVPNQRKIAKKYLELSLDELNELLHSKIHEHRQTALLILVDKYKKIRLDSSPLRLEASQARQEIFDFYLKNTKYINNWDLVDLSAPNIVGNFLLNSNRKVLYKLTVSKNLWEKRIAILATYAFIKNNDFDDILKISTILINDKHDLIHKALGWMLREVGKKNQEVLENFLKKHYRTMPRTMLRYAIEKFDEKKRKSYLL